MVKAFTPMPNTCPSTLYSSMGATTELAKPVIGTRVPAPANLVIFGKMFRPVSRMLRPMRKSWVQAMAASFSTPAAVSALITACPRTQISPPTRNAHSMLIPLLWTGVISFT